jgi:hypothetical protein
MMGGGGACRMLPTHNMFTMAMAAEGITRIALSSTKHAACATAPQSGGESLREAARLKRNVDACVGVGLRDCMAWVSDVAEGTAVCRIWKMDFQ